MKRVSGHGTPKQVTTSLISESFKHLQTLNPPLTYVSSTGLAPFKHRAKSSGRAFGNDPRTVLARM